MALALEQIQRMRGGAQSHLMRCVTASSGTLSATASNPIPSSSPGGVSGTRKREEYDYYVVKFQNNPQRARILANELPATRLAARIGLPAPPVAVVEVREELVAHTADLVMQLGRGRAPCRAGLQFGSRYPGSPAETVVYDFLNCAKSKTWEISAACSCLTNGPATRMGGRRSFFAVRAMRTTGR